MIHSTYCKFYMILLMYSFALTLYHGVALYKIFEDHLNSCIQKLEGRQMIVLPENLYV